MKKINYELYRNNNRESNAYGKVYARVKLGQTVGLKERKQGHRLPCKWAEEKN